MHDNIPHECNRKEIKSVGGVKNSCLVRNVGYGFSISLALLNVKERKNSPRSQSKAFKFLFAHARQQPARVQSRIRI